MDTIGLEQRRRIVLRIGREVTVPGADATPERMKLLWWSDTIFLAIVVALPVVAGIATAPRWQDADASFYSTVAGLIATLFIAITVEFYLQLKSKWRGKRERACVTILLVLSWSGLFASVAALIHQGQSLNSGLACTGLVAASAVVSMSFTERLRGKKQPRQNFVALLFIVPPVVLLAIL